MSRYVNACSCRRAGEEASRCAPEGGGQTLRGKSDAGQMAVELAACIPVMIAVAALALGLISWMGDCARFDRMAAEAVRVHGTSPGYGEYGTATCEAAVKNALVESLDGIDGLEVEVSSTELGAISGYGYGNSTGLVFSLLPTHRRYVCTMRRSVPFFGSGVFGLRFPKLEHAYEIVVDPFEPQPWM